MSIDLVNSEISRFLRSAEPEVLCMRGRWGVGKTYTWTRRLEEVQREGEVALARYSYVSLFGINSLDELKFTIFENTINLSTGITRPDIGTLDDLVSSNISQWRKLTRIAQSIPIIRSFVGGEAPAILSFLTVRDQIICIDDLERRGQKLDITDVLGLVSYLREQRGCKVTLILNDEALDGTDRGKFETHLEKVVDVSLAYKPTAFQSISVALGTGDPISKKVAERCTSLGISNIRVIKRIERVVHTIQPLLKDYDDGVFNQVTSSLVLFCWARDQPGEAPTLEFLSTKKTKALFGTDGDDTIPANEAAWNAVLEAYGYTWTDEFDLALIEGVRNGFFDPAEIGRHAKELHEKLLATKADGSFEDAWRLYHDSFDHNQDEVLDTLFASFMKNYRYISPMNLNGTVKLFKELGRLEQALEMISFYVSHRTESREFFDIEQYPFSGDITDPDIIKAFGEKCLKLERRRSVPELLLSLKDDWNAEILTELSAAPEDEYYRAFRQTHGKELRRMLSGVFQFDRISNASPEMKEITRRARSALKIIGAESPINARRVANYGVIVDEQDTSHTS